MEKLTPGSQVWQHVHIKG